MKKGARVLEGPSRAFFLKNQSQSIHLPRDNFSSRDLHTLLQ
jgi:hypothetical protein